MAGDAVWLDVLPAMDGFATKLAQDAAAAAKKAGTSSGAEWAKSFKGSAGDSGSAAVVAELESAAKRTKKVVEDQTSAIGNARARQREAAAKVVEAEKKLADARAKGDASKVEAAELRLEGARERAKSAANKLESAEGSLRSAQNEHKTVTGQLEKATKGLKDETDKANKAAAEGDGAWGKLTTAVGTAKGKFDEATGGIGGMVGKLAAAAGGAALFASAWAQNMDLEAGTAKVAAQLDLTEEQSATAGDVAGSLYASAYGESMDEVTGAVGSVMSSIEGMASATPAELESVTAAALDLASAFGLDVSEASAAAGLAIQNGLATDATHAFDLITASLQQVPEAMRGEVIDAANEYGGVMAGLGLSGEEAFGLLAKASEGGTIGIDKVGDSLKELSIRATDMSTASVEAYQAAGLNAEDMAAKFLAGGDTAKGALDELVAGLQGIEDPVERSNAAIALFGTPLEDLGVNEIPTFLEGLSTMDSSLGDVAGSAAEMGATLNDNTATSLETVKRSFMTTLSEGIEPLLGPAQSFLDWASETPGVMTAVGVALGVVAVAWAAMTLAASPWLAIGAAIAVVIGGVILAVQNWGAIVDWLREKWEPIAGWFSEKFTAIKDGISTAWQTVQDNLKKGWDWIGANVFEPVKTGAQWVADKFVAMKDGIGTAWQAVQDGLAAGWDWIGANVFEPVKTGAQWVADKFVAMKDGIGTAWQAVQDGLAAGWDWIGTNVFEPLKKGVEAIGTAFDATKDFIGEAWEKIKEAAARPVNFVIETVYTNGIKAVWDKIADAVGLDLKLPSVSPIGGYAVGGYTGDGGKDEPAGVVHRGEFVIQKERVPRYRTLLEAIHRGADVPGYATGGEVDGPSFWDRVGGVVSGIGSGIKDLVVNVAAVLSDPVGSLTSMLAAPVEALLGQVTGGALGRMLVEIPRKVIDGLIGKAKDLIAALMPQWVRPASGPVTSEYGLRNGAFHAGIDIGTAGPTVAAAAGTVTSTGWNILGGRTGIGIILEHGNGYRTYYGHNPEGGVQVKSGQSVTAGQHIGYGGNTGNSTGNHLHFEVHKNGATINPRDIGVFDTGGTLKPRGVAVNLSNADERVLTDQQWQAISALASRGAGGVGVSLPSHVTLVDEQGGFIARTRVEAREVIAVEMAGASRHKRARGAA